ncbi:MAG: calcium-binding protein, partial [Ruegeria sp.]
MSTDETRPSGLDLVPIEETTDASAGTDTAYTLEPGDVFQGQIFAPGDVDWIRLALEPDETYVFWADTADNAGLFEEEFANLVSYAQYDDAGELVLGTDAQFAQNPAVVLSNLGVSDAYIALGNFSNSLGYYRARLQVLNEKSDAAPDTSTTAAVEVEAPFIGTFENVFNGSDSDFVAVFLTAGVEYQAFLTARESFDGTANRPRMELQDGFGRTVADSTVYDRTPFDAFSSGESMLTYTAEETGLHYFNLFGEVNGYGYPSTYQLVIEEVPEFVEPNVDRVGTRGSDTLLGKATTDDILIGLAGNDFIDGRGGADRMEGGPGNDRFVVDDVNDTVLELKNEGRDTVQTVLPDYRLLAHFEDLTYTGAQAFKGIGNGAANTITGGASDDVLRGQKGNDELIGLGGSDKLFGAGGDDILLGGAGDQVLLVGGAGADLLDGGAGDDTLKGGGGNDWLEGGEGDDQLEGGKGDDIYIL